jgi:cell division protein ZipA
MWELRWILLGMGALLIAGVYLWNRKPFSVSFKSRSDPGERAEPSISTTEAESSSDAESPPEEIKPTSRPTQRQRTDRVVTLRLIGHGQTELSCEHAVRALKNAGLVHGEYGIFHYLPKNPTDEPSFSVANLTEPGSFNVTESTDSTIPGMSFFIVLPGPADPIASFDAMVNTARKVSQELNAELFDERGSSWSIQRERYIREEIIEYRHQLSQA